MRSVLFSLAAILSFAKAAEDRVCLRPPSKFPCRTPQRFGGCPPPEPFKHDGPCPSGSSELNEISPTADQKWRRCRRPSRNARPFDWKGPCPKGYGDGMEIRARVCKKLRCQGGELKCTIARTTPCHNREKEISPNLSRSLKDCQIKDCQIKPSRYCSKSCSLRRCRVKVSGDCPLNTNRIRRHLEKRSLAGRSNGRTNGNDYEAGLLDIPIGNDYGAGDNGGDDYEGDYEADDYKDDDYEDDDYEDDDYEDDDYEDGDYEDDDYKK